MRIRSAMVAIIVIVTAGMIDASKMTEEAQVAVTTTDDVGYRQEILKKDMEGNSVRS